MSLGFRTVLFSPLVPDGSGAETMASGVRYRWRGTYLVSNKPAGGGV